MTIYRHPFECPECGPTICHSSFQALGTKAQITAAICLKCGSSGRLKICPNCGVYPCECEEHYHATTHAQAYKQAAERKKVSKRLETYQSAQHAKESNARWLSLVTSNGLYIPQKGLADSPRDQADVSPSQG